MNLLNKLACWRWPLMRTLEKSEPQSDTQERTMSYLPKSKRHIHTLVIHSTATKADRNVTAAEIDSWHKQRGWTGIGYHLVIRRDGSAELGRNIHKQGAHIAGHNRGTIGVVMVGGLSDSHAPEANFTKAQFKTLRHVLDEQISHYPDLKIIGHRDLKPTACPSFDVRHWLATGQLKA